MEKLNKVVGAESQQIDLKIAAPHHQAHMNMRTIFITLTIGLCAALLMLLAKGMRPMAKSSYPNPPKIPHVHRMHGDSRNDEYFWMRDRDTKPVLDFLEAENRRTLEALRPVAELEHQLFLEMRARIKEDDASVPVPEAGFFYYSRYVKGQEYEIHCRKKGSLESPEEIVLDENQLAQGLPYMELGDVQTSPDQRYLAYAVDSVGRRIYDLYVKDLETGKVLKDHVAAITANVVWAADNKTLFYVRQDPKTLRAYQVYRYELGSGKSDLVYEEKDTTYNVSIDVSKRHGLLLMSIYKRDSSEWRLLDAHKPKGDFEVFWPRENDHEYSLVDGGDRLYILTNWRARNFRVMEAAVGTRDKAQWKEVIPPSDKIFIEAIDVFEKFLVINERENGLTQLRTLGRGADKTNRVLKFPDPVFEVVSFNLPDYASAFLRFKYESLVQPPSVYDETFAGEKRELKKVREVPGYNPNLYESRRDWATASDGTKIPISLLMKKGLVLDGSHPTLMEGYGSYGFSNGINFRASIFSLVDRGFVYALPHIRGGSEMGREWYEQGRLKHKMNTFTDFIAVTEKLITDKYTSAKHLYMIGASAGGLLMGAVMNLRPDLYNGVVAGVPFVDVLTTMLDETIPLTTGEYKEWGDPRIKDQYEYMKTYSPYDNVAAKSYPNLLVTTGYHDSQVQYWEPAKWVARLRDLKTNDNLVLLYTELDAGHAGASGRFEALKNLAKQDAFILMLEGFSDKTL